MSSILQKVNPNTLVLIDELGAGTEPNEGSALALAITEYLLKSGTRGILTTHYGSLKEYALVTQGVRNACMEFDPKTFAPTYKLILGVPGSSNAIQIASNLGLNSEIIINARSKISSEKQSFEKVLQNAEQIRQQYEKQKDEIESKAVDLTNELQKAKEQNKILAQEREKLLKNSRVEAKQIITDAQNDAEELLDQLKKIVHTAQLDEKSLFEARSVVKKLNNRKYVTDDKDDDDSLFLGENVKFDSLQVGSKVFVKSLNTVGVVQRIEKGEKAQIKCGNITSVVPASDLYDFVDTSEKQVKTAKTTKLNSEHSLLNLR